MQVEDFIQRQEAKGKVILKTLVVVNLLLFVLMLLLGVLNGIFNNFIGLIIMIVLCVLIYYGGNVAKWIYIVINTLNTFSLLYALTVGEIISRAKVFAIFLNALTITMLVISVVTSVILIFSSSVKDFMYKQKDSY